MFSLQKFLGKDPKFFDLLESSANEARSCAQILAHIIRDPSSTAQLHDIRKSRQTNKRITEEIDELVVKSFITTLEREDIEALSNALYKIPKPIEKFAERYIISQPFIPEVDFSRQVALLEQGTEVVVSMVRELRKGNNLEAVKKLNARLQQLEGEGDALELELLRDLFNSKRHSLKIIIIKDLYDLLEKVVDRCRDAGNAVTHVFLKNS